MGIPVLACTFLIHLSQKNEKKRKNVLTIKEQNGIIDEYRARDENI